MENTITRHILVNAFKRNKAIHIALFSFVLLSALLMATGSLVIQRLSGSIDHINTIAKPPHFLQMHIGPVDAQQISSFSDQTGLVDRHHIEPLVNIEGANLTFRRQDGTTGSFSDSLLDNYFTEQNTAFDFLLDTTNKKIALQSGHVGLPIVYASKYRLALGDTLIVHLNGQRRTLTISHLVRDAQMGSSLASSIRFLVAADDFAWLHSNGEKHESIIAFRLFDASTIDRFQAMYTDEGRQLPKNGVAITLPLIKLVNSIGDGLMGGVIILVSLILMAISMLNIRFALLESLQADVRQIATLKAIGLSRGDIKHLYQTKYWVIAIVAVVLAALLAIPLSNTLVTSIALNFGTSAIAWWSYLIPFVSGGVIYTVVMAGVALILRRIDKLSIVDALTTGQLTIQANRRHLTLVPKLTILTNRVNSSLAIHQFRMQFKSWLILMIIFFFSSLAIVMPLNIWMTLTSPDFVNYMGAAKSDLRIAFEQTPRLAQQLTEIDNQLRQAPEVDVISLFKLIKGKTTTAEGTTTMMIESGQYDHYQVALERGHLPTADGQMAISTLNAMRLKLDIGQSLTINFGTKSYSFTVVGIYQDMTNGGLTSKISQVIDVPAMSYAYFVDLKPGADLSAFVTTWSEQLPFAKVIPIETLLSQTLGSITTSLKYAVAILFVIALVTTGLVIVMFLLLNMRQNARNDAIELAMGFKYFELRMNYLLNSAIAMLIGIGGGLLVSLTLGEQLMTSLIAVLGLGLTRLEFLINPFYMVLMGVVIPIAVGLTLTWVISARVKQTSLMSFTNS